MWRSGNKLLTANHLAVIKQHSVALVKCGNPWWKLLETTVAYIPQCALWTNIQNWSKYEIFWPQIYIVVLGMTFFVRSHTFFHILFGLFVPFLFGLVFTFLFNFSTISVKFQFNFCLVFLFTFLSIHKHRKTLFKQRNGLQKWPNGVKIYKPQPITARIQYIQKRWIFIL